MTSSIVARLVVPTWAPSSAALSSVSVVAFGEVAVLHDDDRLVAEVVALGQVGVLGALRVERHLVDEEVEVLRARRERVVEADLDPGDLVAR